MKTIKGPAIFLAQFAGDVAPFNRLDEISGWAAALGYKGVQIPAWDGRFFDLRRAAESRTYCDEIRGCLASNRVELTELSTHLQVGAERCRVAIKRDTVRALVQRIEIGPTRVTVVLRLRHRRAPGVWS